MKYGIHISDVRSFKQCRRKWDWSSPLRQNLEHIVTYAPFFTGKAIHYAMQQYYENGEEMCSAAERYIKEEIERMQQVGALWDVEKERIEDQTALVYGMLAHYQSWARTEKGVWSDQNLNFIALETEFDVPLHNPRGRASARVHLEGRFDGVVQRKDDGTFWIFETKTTRSIKELQDSLYNDEQAGAYMIAASRIIGERISGVLYNILRKKVPTMPQVLQNGTLSRRADADTTAEAFVEAAFRQHPEDSHEQIIEYYKDYIDMLLAKGNTFFERTPVYRTPAEMVQLEKQLWIVALEMVRPTTPIYPAPSWLNCRFCSFRGPCLAMNAGADFGYILNEEYRVREKWDPLEAKEEGGSNGGESN